jgi:hypothetical protein
MTQNERAAQLWSILVLAARNQQILSYAMVEKLTGLDRRGVGDCLGPVQAYCKRYDLPPLTSIVVKQETGLPGIGFTAATTADVLPAQGRVFVYDWLSRGAPSAEDFAAIS